MPTERRRAAMAETRELTYAEAIREALRRRWRRDERVFLIGEDIGVYGGAFGVTGDLVHRFGAERVIDTPITELGVAGAAVGAALTGMRPVLEFQFSDFVTLAMEQIVNQAAKIRFMFGGKASVPLVDAPARRFRHRRRGAAQPEPRGLVRARARAQGVQPSTPHDAKGLLLAAIDDPESGDDLRAQASLQDEGAGAGRALPRADRPGGRAPRRGAIVTIVATSIMVHRARRRRRSASRSEGIDAEVIDLRSLRPIDFATIAASVRKTGIVCSSSTKASRRSASARRSAR